MSQSNSNLNVTKVGSAGMGAGIAIGAVCLAVAGALFTASKLIINDLATGDVTQKTNKLKPEKQNLLYSTPICKNEFKDLFMSDLSANRTEVELLRYKESFIKTLSYSNFKVENTKQIENNIIQTLEAGDVKIFNKNANKLMAEVEMQHTEILQKELTNKIKEAAAEIGFTKIKVVERTESVRIITAENSIGQAIVNEVRTKNDLNIDHSYETVGITDNSCKEIIKQFKERLTAKGVIADKCTEKSTSGIPFLNSSKEVMKNLKLRKFNGGCSRSLKLNTNNKQYVQR